MTKFTNVIVRRPAKSMVEGLSLIHILDVYKRQVQKGANPASRHFRFRRARNAAMGSMRTPRLLALTARSPWMFAT